MGTFSALPAEDSISPLLQIDFDGDLKEDPVNRLLSDPNLYLAEGKGPDSSNAIKVAYVGYPRGSERATVRLPLGRIVDEATLSFDVKFEKDFQWTKGGKLHGLAPKKPITGGAKRIPQAWSARLMFREEGKVQNYLYDQDQSKKYGVGERTKEGVFKAGQWHRVVFELKLNDPGKKNGHARAWVDGKPVTENKGMEFRGKGGDETGIQLFMFSTFHGGHSKDYSPVDEDGEFTTVYAWFDNFEVVEGRVK